jgi:hypothetical protein
MGELKYGEKADEWWYQSHGGVCMSGRKETAYEQRRDEGRETGGE